MDLRLNHERLLLFAISDALGNAKDNPRMINARHCKHFKDIFVLALETES